MIESWRPVKGFEGVYEVSSHGRIRSLHARWRTIRMLQPKLNGDGYPEVHLRFNGISRLRRVHRLVAEAFLGPAPKGKSQVNHLDLVKNNNHVSNLEYVSNDENMAHAAAAGLFRGTSNAAARLTEDQVRQIRSEYIFGTPANGTRALARKFGMSQYAVHRVVSNRSWTHI